MAYSNKTHQVYIHKIVEHDITHQYGINREIVDNFFGQSTNVTFYRSDDKERNSPYLANLLFATDPRFNSVFSSVFAGDNPNVGDLLFINKLKDGSFTIELIKQSSPIYPLLNGLYLEGNDRHAVLLNVPTQDLNLPLQKIYYGAPGTGKSQTIKSQTAGADIYRTTFHPDSDYSTFVGAYKPAKDKDSGKITYKFIQQCFTKAYVSAWKKYLSDVCMLNAQDSSIQFMVGKDIYRLKEVTDECVIYDKEFAISRSSINKVWNRFWEQGTFKPQSNTSGEGAQEAAALKMHELSSDVQKEDFDTIWDKLASKLSQDSLKVNTPSVTSSLSYILTKVEDNQLYYEAKDRKSTKDTLSKYFVNGQAGGVVKGILEILKKYDENNFENAWSKLKKDCKEHDNSTDYEVVSENESTPLAYNAKPVYLIIEEINRGNCAQIFGDIFQLLDRNKWGFSEYPIEADQDLAMELKREFEGLYMDDALKNQINRLYEKEYPSGVVKDILEGDKLLLPGNLSILATMNTSDQSLFPMDSAFKRRWTWEYTKIEAPKNKDDKMFIELENDNKGEGEPKTVFKPWLDVVTTINNYIKKQLRSSDKQIGYWFVKSDCEVEINGKTRKGISMDQFRDKVLFYLFDDAFKDDEDFANLFGSDTYLFVDLLSEQDLVKKVSGVLKEMEK